jgi:hypothetical protein
MGGNSRYFSNWDVFYEGIYLYIFIALEYIAFSCGFISRYY